VYSIFILEILTKVVAPPGLEGTFRPKLIPDSCSIDLATLMEKCWNENPVLRPTFKTIGSTIRKISV